MSHYLATSFARLGALLFFSLPPLVWANSPPYDPNNPVKHSSSFQFPWTLTAIIFATLVISSIVIAAIIHYVAKSSAEHSPAPKQ